MNGWKKTLSVATMLMVMTQTQPVLANEVKVDTPIPIRAEAQSMKMEISGEVCYVDLEGGFYAVDGWRLIGDDAEFERYLGLSVIVVGTPFEGMSIQMVKAINVEDVFLGSSTSDPDRPILAPILAPITTPISAVRTLPAMVTVNGESVRFDQHPIMVDNVVMLPLRAVVTAAGGAIEWIESELTAKVELAGRTVRFAVGKTEATEGRQQISMAQPPQLVAGRVLVSADALSGAFGMHEVVRDDSQSLDLSTIAPEDLATRLIGVIKEIELLEKPRILVSAGRMISGEPNLVWAYVDEATKIAAEGAVGGLDSLEVGQNVEVLITGPMNLSYPAMAKADAIIVKNVTEPVVEEEAETRMIGTVKDIQSGEFMRILVEGSMVGQGGSTLVWVTISFETTVSAVDGMDAEFAVGQSVDVLLTGPMLMSYPAQGGATEVIILGAAS